MAGLTSEIEERWEAQKAKRAGVLSNKSASSGDGRSRRKRCRGAEDEKGEVVVGMGGPLTKTICARSRTLR
jgi:hypothetical protein